MIIKKLIIMNDLYPLDVTEGRILYGVIRTAIRAANYNYAPKNERAILVWNDTIKDSDYFSSLHPWQVVNRLPSVNIICRKAPFVRLIQRIQTHFPLLYDFLPRSFILPIQNSEFIQRVSRHEKKYIIKPDNGSLGQGITILDEKMSYNPVSHLSIAQEYTESCLVDDTKFDCRIYVLVTSIEDLQIYVYRGGVARFCSQKYGSNTIYSQITNTAVNRKNPGTTVEKITRMVPDVFEQLAKQGVNIDLLWEEIDKVAVFTILSVYNYLLQGVKKKCPSCGYSRCFQILGFDILIDRKYKPKLLEVNYRPSLERDTESEGKMKCEMLSEAMKIAAPLNEIQKRLSRSKINYNENGWKNFMRANPSLADVIEKQRKANLKDSHFIQAYPSNDPQQNEIYKEVIQKVETLPLTTESKYRLPALHASESTNEGTSNEKLPPINKDNRNTTINENKKTNDQSNHVNAVKSGDMFFLQLSDSCDNGEKGNFQKSNSGVFKIGNQQKSNLNINIVNTSNDSHPADKNSYQKTSTTSSSTNNSIKSESKTISNTNKISSKPSANNNKEAYTIENTKNIDANSSTKIENKTSTNVNNNSTKSFTSDNSSKANSNTTITNSIKPTNNIDNTANTTTNKITNGTSTNNSTNTALSTSNTTLTQSSSSTISSSASSADKIISTSKPLNNADKATSTANNNSTNPSNANTSIPSNSSTNKITVIAPSNSAKTSSGVAANSTTNKITSNASSISSRPSNSTSSANQISSMTAIYCIRPSDIAGNSSASVANGSTSRITAIAPSSSAKPSMTTYKATNGITAIHPSSSARTAAASHAQAPAKSSQISGSTAKCNSESASIAAGDYYSAGSSPYSREISQPFEETVKTATASASPNRSAAGSSSASSSPSAESSSATISEPVKTATTVASASPGRSASRNSSASSSPSSKSSSVPINDPVKTATTTATSASPGRSAASSSPSSKSSSVPISEPVKTATTTATSASPGRSASRNSNASSSPSSVPISDPVKTATNPSSSPNPRASINSRNSGRAAAAEVSFLHLSDSSDASDPYTNKTVITDIKKPIPPSETSALFLNKINGIISNSHHITTDNSSNLNDLSLIDEMSSSDGLTYLLSDPGTNSIEEPEIQEVTKNVQTVPTATSKNQNKKNNGNDCVLFVLDDSHDFGGNSSSNKVPFSRAKSTSLISRAQLGNKASGSNYHGCQESSQIEKSYLPKLNQTGQYQTAKISVSNTSQSLNTNTFNSKFNCNQVNFKDSAKRPYMPKRFAPSGH